MGTTVDPAVGREPAVTVGALVGEVANEFAATGAPGDCAAEARALIAALYDEPLFWPGLNAHVALDGAWRGRALRAAAKRIRGAPLAYCVGRAPFRHLMLEVDERVLIPRPETEQLVDVAMAAAGPDGGGVAVDVGTGSGAIALALATEGHFERIVATDVSLDALAVARGNTRALAEALRAPVELRHGSLLKPVGDLRPRLVVSNPPYIASPESAALPASVRDWEPPVALFSGRDGMAATARLVRQASERLAPAGALVLEVDSRRAGVAADLAARNPRFTGVRVLQDLAGRDRFVVARRTEDP